MKKILPFILIASIAINLSKINAATVINVSAGTISANTAWNADTVRVNGNITIGSTATLTIAAKTYVLFTGYYKLTVNGIINANGALGDTIIFSRYQNPSDTAGFFNFSNTNGGWAGIEINSLTYSDSNIFRFCKIEFIKNMEDYPKGLKYLSGKSLYLRQSVYSNNLGCIYSNAASGLYIDSCIFSKNNNYKYPYSDWNSRCIEIFTWNASNLYIRNNNIWSSSSTAIRIYSGNNVQIKKNIFIGDKKADNYSSLNVFLSLENTKSIISNNSFVLKSGSPLGINVDGGYAIIDSNSIAKLVTAIYLKSSSSGKVRGNAIDTCTNGINSSSSFFYISNNKITGCTSQAAFFHAFCIDTLVNNTFRYNEKAIEFNQSNAEIINNIVVNSKMYGITFNKSNVSIINCLIANNSGNGFGSAINAMYSTANITNSTIINNSDLAGTNAPVVYASSGGEVINTIIYGNEANSMKKQISVTDNDIQPSFYNCNIQNGSPQFVLAPGVTFSGKFENCIDEALALTISNPTAGAGNSYNALAGSINWAPKTSSICINSGNTLKNSLSTDLLGNSRVYNGIIDIGAIETRIPKMTYGGANISSTVRWMADTIVVNNSFTINNNGSLSIDPGVTVLFTGNYAITCNGLLKAKGNEKSKITFTRASGGWGGFNFYKDDTEDDTSQFLYCNFKNLTSQITVNDRNKFKMNSNTFESSTASSSFNFIVFTNSIVQFQSNELKNINSYNTLVRADFSTVNFVGNTIHDINGQEAISVNESDLNLTHNKIFNYTCGTTLIRCYNSKGNICNNLIVNNNITYNGISFDNAWSDFYIANNTVSRNTVGSMLFYLVNSVVENNIVVNNSNNTLWSFYLYPSTFRNNYVSTNDASGGCVNCIIDSYPLFISPTYVNGVTVTASNADWHITQFSQAINKGYSDVSKLNKTDLDGNSRIIDNKVDMGAYEHQGSLVEILTQPLGGTYCANEKVELNILVSDTCLFQWQFNGKNIAGANNDTLIIDSVSVADQGSYTCKAINGYGATVSSSAIVNVNTIPEILSTPESRFVTTGSAINIEVPVSGAKPITISWYKNDTLKPLLNKAELRIPSFGTLTEGTYKMISENSCGSDTSAEFALSVLPSTYIQNNDTLLCEGESVVIITKASNGSTFQWYKNGSIIIGSISSNLSFSSISKDDEGSYSCIVQGLAGTVETSPILISVRQKPEISAAPLSSFITLASEVKSSVSANGTLPLIYKWYKAGNQIIGVNKAILTITSFESANEGVFKVYVQNVCGIDSSANFALYLEPKITFTDNQSVFCEGKRAVIKISKSFNGNILWYANGSIVSGENKDSLVIAAVTKNNEGSYQCSITTDYGSIFSNQLYLISSQTPQFSTQPASQWVADNASLTSEVNASGSTPLIYQWFRNDTIINGENSSRLLFAGFTKNDQKIYKCVVSNLCGNDTSEKAAFMIDPVIKLNTANGEPVVCENTSVNLSVSASFNPSYQWKKDGQNISGATSSMLSLTSVTELSKGNYSCSITNTYGQTETSPLFLQVLSKPLITSDPISQWVYNGSAFSLKMIVEGSKPLKYKWIKNDALTTDSMSELNFPTFGAANEGKYYCIVTNSCGTDTTNAAKVLIAPELSTPSGATVCENDTFELRIIFNDSANIQWFKDGALLPTLGKIFILAKPQFKSIGNYSCRISNANGYAILGPIQLTIAKAPSVDPLKDVSYVDESLSTSLTLNAFGDEPLNYQWFKNGSLIVGKTSQNLSLDNIVKNDEATYKCQISNICGTTETNETKLVIAPQICMVTNALQNDTNKNMLIWDRNSSNVYEYYTVYREGFVRGEYQEIGRVPYNNVTVLIDSFVNPKSQAYVYKITATDKDGIETDINATAQHKTIHLLVTQGIPSGIQLDWDEYIGFDYKTYHIFRSTDNSIFEKIHDMASTTRTWTDFDAPISQSLKYYIAVDRSQSCSAISLRKAGAGPLTSAISNMEDNSRLRSTGIEYNSLNYNILSIYPNPFSNYAEVFYKLEKASKVELSITDFSGKQVQLLIKANQQVGGYKLVVGEKLQSGIYFLNVNIDGQLRNYKFVKL